MFSTDTMPPIYIRANTWCCCPSAYRDICYNFQLQICTQIVHAHLLACVRNLIEFSVAYACIQWHEIDGVRTSVAGITHHRHTYTHVAPNSTIKFTRINRNFGGDIGKNWFNKGNCATPSCQQWNAINSLPMRINHNHNYIAYLDDFIAFKIHNFHRRSKYVDSSTHSHNDSADINLDGFKWPTAF